MNPARASWFGPAALGLLCLAMFGDVLLAPGGRVFGLESTDMAYQFLQWRDFGFAELARGNLALWNPHIYGGAPFFGGMQSALLYPPNWLYLVLPVEVAANWTIALDIWLLGAFMFWWASRRGLHPFAAFVSAALLMFCAPHFLRVASGHATNLAAMAWVPLIFLCIDEWLRTQRAGWCLLGMLAVAMQVFAGHPQYLYYTGLVAGAYALLRLAESGVGRPRAAAGLASIYAGGALLAAVQLLAGFEATSETVRDVPLPFDLAASFGFPPENLLTFLAPGFFGDAPRVSYWGRWLPWEASGFIGVGGLMLAVYGVAGTRPDGRRAMLAATGISVLLATSPDTPLFRVLYEWLPFFDKFRASGKFIFFTAVFLTLFAGFGLDRLLREARLPRRALIGAAAMVFALCAGAAMVRLIDWHPIVALSLASGQTYMHPSRYLDTAFIQGAAAAASNGLLLSALIVVALAALALWGRVERRAVFVVGALAVAELFIFARLHRPTFNSENDRVALVRVLLAKHPGDYRILNAAHPNSAMVTGAYDGWGYDPSVTRRYAELMQWTQGEDVSIASQHMTFHDFHRLHSMLRLKYRIEESAGVARITPTKVAPMKHLELIGGYRVRTGRDSILAALGEPDFDPLKEVILEREPHPAPVAAPARGRAVVTRQGTDFLEIDADVSAPSLLLVTDAWTPAWRALALPGSAAERYELMPANYALRAVPLGAGRHRLRLQYAPTSFRLGAAVSLLAWLAWLAAGVMLWQRTRNLRHA